VRHGLHRFFGTTANKRPYEWEFRKGEEVLPVEARARLMTSDPGTMLDACVAGAGIVQIMQPRNSGLARERRARRICFAD